MSDIQTYDDPFDSSLWGEYTRMLLVGATACSGVVWAFHLMMGPAAILMVIANALVLAVAFGNQFAGIRRLAFLLLLMFAIVAILLAKQDPAMWWSPQVMFSPVLTLIALFVLLIRDGWIVVQGQSAKLTPGLVFVIVMGLALATYMIVIPTIDASLEPFRDRPTSYTLEDPTKWEILRIRSAKLAVFAIFAYAGACVGSFLNVVAASAPRREPIALRSSACPRCGTPIRRIDNLPIISYLRLGGRCRDCQIPIPLRYFVVELLGLAIFASLFLYELVTGAANVPGFKHYHHAGILWIILYTKWPVVGVYFYHCFLFCCLLMLALMEQDHLRAPRWMKVALLLGFAGLAIASPTLLTVSLGDQTPFQVPSTLPEWLDRAATCFAGGLLGWGIGLAAKSVRLRNRQANTSLPWCFALLGITLGWQAVLIIACFWLIAISLLKLTAGRRLRPRWLTPSTLLFAVALFHHPAWKMLAERLAFSA